MKDYGVKLAIDMIKKLATGGVRGVNFCTLNLEKSVHLILEGLRWTVHHDDHHVNKLINASTPHSPKRTRSQKLTSSPQMADHEPSSSETDLTISAHKVSGTVAQNLTDQPVKMSGIGRGEATSASTWDEFPNGRFGDFKSPAYGVQDPWGGPTSHPVRQLPSHIACS